MSGQEEEALLFGARPTLHWSGRVVGGPGREAASNLPELGMAKCFCVLLRVCVCVCVSLLLQVCAHFPGMKNRGTV